MPDHFQLGAIVKRRGMIELLHIPLQQSLQINLAQAWRDQSDRFMEGVDEIDFDAGYRPERHERFRITPYELPEWLSNETGESLPELETLGCDGSAFGSIDGLVAFARYGDSEEQLLFQNFTPSKIIEPGRFLFLTEDTYGSTPRSGLTLGQALSAVYERTDGKLLFANFRSVNTFLPLAEYYREASSEEIREILAHDSLHVADPDVWIAESAQWFRKRFAMLRESGILDEYSPSQIEAKSMGYDVTVEIRDGKVSFPETRGEAKKLLQFLNEELFRGPITETLYETNSKRRAS